jgi:hypothetical protein
MRKKETQELRKEFQRGTDEQTRIRKKSILSNSISQQPPKMNKDKRNSNRINQEKKPTKLQESDNTSQ